MPDTKKRLEGAFIGEKPVLKNTEWRETKLLCRKDDIFKVYCSSPSKLRKNGVLLALKLCLK